MWTNVVSENQITAMINLTTLFETGIPPGSWDISIVNPDGYKATLANGFTVLNASPTLTSITPNHGEKGTRVYVTNISGADFVNVPDIQLWYLVPEGYYEIVHGKNVVLTGSTKITCTLDIPTNARAGLADFKVINPDGGSGWIPYGFTIDPGYVTATVSPSSVTIGQNVRIAGINSDNATTFLYLMGQNCDTNGCPLTDLTKKASDGYFTKVTNAADMSFEYIWDTSKVKGNLVPGTYGIIIESDPVDFAHRTGHQYVKGAIEPVSLFKVIPLPGFSNPPTDPDRDGLYEDLNANNRKDFNDVVLMFNHMQWIAANEPVSAFDFNGNGRIDFNDIVKSVRGGIIHFFTVPISISHHPRSSLLFELLKN